MTRTIATLALLWLLIASAVAVGVLVGSIIAPDAAASRPASLSSFSPAAERTGTPHLQAVPAPPTASPVPGRITPSPTVTGSSPEPVRKTRTANTLRGLATWFDSPAGVSAAGPDLRAALGPGWRGATVTVCAGDRCLVTVLGDWCGCGPRPGGSTVIDLHAPLFARLAPLSRGVLAVEVTW